MLPQMHLFHPEVQKFVLAAECLLFHDVTPQSVSQVNLEAIRYYVQCLSHKFASTPSCLSNYERHSLNSHSIVNAPEASGG
jgi:hypothetical protein